MFTKIFFKRKSYQATTVTWAETYSLSESQRQVTPKHNASGVVPWGQWEGDQEKLVTFPVGPVVHRMDSWGAIRVSLCMTESYSKEMEARPFTAESFNLNLNDRYYCQSTRK